jgi:regulator of vacuolar morphogenesis
MRTATLDNVSLQMSRKRHNTSSPESDYSPPSKKLRSPVHSEIEGEDEGFDDFDEPPEQPRLNTENGQYNAFPGLVGYEDEPFYGPAMDGIDYLRMVRSVDV